MSKPSVSEKGKALMGFILQSANTLRWVGYSVGLLFTLQWLFHFDQIIAAVQSIGIGGLAQFMIDGFINFLQYALDDFIPTGLVVISVLLGLTFAMLRYIKQQPSPMTPKTTRTVSVSLLGAGCAACGGSILAPFLSFLPVATANQANNLVGRLLIATGLVLAMISFWQTLGMLSVLEGRRQA